MASIHTATQPIPSAGPVPSFCACARIKPYVYERKHTTYTVNSGTSDS